MFVIQLEDRGRIGPQDLFANPGQVIRIEERSNHKACTTPAREGCPKAASQCHTFSRPAPHLRGKDVPRLPPNVTPSPGLHHTCEGRMSQGCLPMSHLLQACTTPAREGCPKAASQCHLFLSPSLHLSIPHLLIQLLPARWRMFTPGNVAINEEGSLMYPCVSNSQVEEGHSFWAFSDVEEGGEEGGCSSLGLEEKGRLVGEVLVVAVVVVIILNLDLMFSTSSLCLFLSSSSSLRPSST
ncbi:uncharacterized protein LOC135095244 [Scylla paramamosain]|uniref:uncharacterized protein LOC135095244 n=1 Tax=Scylla paramamosain TaxID=85552 RepID=UPI0030832921